MIIIVILICIIVSSVSMPRSAVSKFVGFFFVINGTVAPEAELSVKLVSCVSLGFSKLVLLGYASENVYSLVDSRNFIPSTRWRFSNASLGMVHREGGGGGWGWSNRVCRVSVYCARNRGKRTVARRVLASACRIPLHGRNFAEEEHEPLLAGDRAQREKWK